MVIIVTIVYSVPTHRVQKHKNANSLYLLFFTIRIVTFLASWNLNEDNYYALLLLAEKPMQNCYPILLPKVTCFNYTAGTNNKVLLKCNKIINCFVQ